MDKVLIWLYSRVSQIFQNLKKMGHPTILTIFFGNLDALTLYFATFAILLPSIILTT